MRYNRIGHAGIRVSAVGLGNWNTVGVTSDRHAALEVLRAAHEVGVNFLDTADTYGKGLGERTLGDFLHETSRDAFVVATKVFFPMSADPNDQGLSRKHIVRGAERALRNLRTDYIDIFQCHRFDAHTPLDETVRAMDDLVRQGKILYWGVSRYSAPQMADCQERSAALLAHRPISNQYFYNLLDRRIEADVLPACAALGMGLIAYSPLAQGVLTGKYLQPICPTGSRGANSSARRDMWQLRPEHDATIERLHAVATRHDLDLASMALAWCLRQPAVCAVLTGASRPEQIRQAAAASDIALDAQILTEIETALTPHPSLGASAACSPWPVDTAIIGRGIACS